MAAACCSSAAVRPFDVSRLGRRAIFRLRQLHSLAGSNLTLTGSSAFAGTVNVDGNLSVNAAMTGANVIVGAGGTLGGTGSIGNTIVNGTLSPGNSPGTLTMASLTHDDGGKLPRAVSGTISDRVVVTDGEPGRHRW